MSLYDFIEQWKVEYAAKQARLLPTPQPAPLSISVAHTQPPAPVATHAEQYALSALVQMHKHHRANLAASGNKDAVSRVDYSVWERASRLSHGEFAQAVQSLLVTGRVERVGDYYWLAGEYAHAQQRLRQSKHTVRYVASAIATTVVDLNGASRVARVTLSDGSTCIMLNPEPLDLLGAIEAARAAPFGHRVVSVELA